jgi:hypothetical protein
MMGKLLFQILLAVSAFLAPYRLFAVDSSSEGLLLMAHGGNKEWNGQVQNIATKINEIMPVEVAFGMANRATLQAGIDKLVARGVKSIVAIPLFVSSHSSVVESTEYLLKQRATAPADLSDFAAMDHGNSGGHTSHGSAATPSSADVAESTRPVQCSVPLRMTPALNRHPLVADILLDRGLAISKNPKKEVFVMVAHGPNEDAENALWLSDMAALAQIIHSRKPFTQVKYLTIRDDAEEKVRNQATEDFRKIVQNADRKGHHVLIVPLLLSYGGIENGIRKRLDGLEHIMSPQGLLPDARITQWILESAGHGPAQTASTQAAHSR